MSDDVTRPAETGESTGKAGDPPDIEANVKNRDTWRRLLFMIVLGAIYGLTRIGVVAVIVLQFFWVLFTSQANEKLTRLGHSLALYTAELIDFLCYVTEERPFPFDRDWPEAG